MSCEPGCARCGHLRAAAVQVVGAGGLPALSTVSLAWRAGCSPAMADRHYPSVIRCLQEAFDEATLDTFMCVAGGFVDAPTWEDGFREGVSSLLRRLTRDPALARLGLIEAGRDRSLRRQRAVGQRWLVELFYGEAIRHGLDDGLTRLQAELLLGAAVQMLTATVMAGRFRELPELLPAIVGLVPLFSPAAASAS